MLHRFQDERGSTAILVALTMTALMGLAALAVDVGQLYITRTHLVQAADAAARAGARDLPFDPLSAVLDANAYAQKNGLDSSEITATTTADLSAVLVSVRHLVPLTFARVLGYTEAPVSAVAAARTGVLSGTRGIVPLAVVKQNFQYGQYVTLKANSNNKLPDAPGNFQAVALGGSGASNYRDNLMYGYTGMMRVGDWIPTETGNMAGPTQDGILYRVGLDSTSTFDSIAADSSRLLILPVVNSFQVNGSGMIQIVGFAAFFLENSQGSGNAGAQVTGRFVRYVLEGETSSSATDFGTRAVKLVQ